LQKRDQVFDLLRARFTLVQTVGGTLSDKFISTTGSEVNPWQCLLEVLFSL